jgi:hypothetical protein
MMLLGLLLLVLLLLWPEGRRSVGNAAFPNNWWFLPLFVPDLSASVKPSCPVVVARGAPI